MPLQRALAQERNNLRPNAPKARRSRALSAEERALWREVTKHDTRLEDLAEAEPDMAPSIPEPVPFVEPRPVMPRRVHAKKIPARAATKGDYAGIDRRTAERFRKGKRELDGKLDLHGMRQAEAHTALARFVASHHAKGSRVLLVVTGKGTPRTKDESPREGVLQRAVPRWLAEPELAPLVLAFDHAQVKDGGSGALYVLLRRERSAKS